MLQSVSFYPNIQLKNEGICECWQIIPAVGVGLKLMGRRIGRNKLQTGEV